MRLLLSVVLFGGLIGTAAAENYDSRLYISPGIAHVIADPGRGVDNGEIFSITAGLPVSASQNYEVELGYGDLDSTTLINFNANLINFFAPNTPGFFGILSAGVLYSEGGPGSDYFSPNVAVGLGAMLPAWFGKLRIEGLLRGDLHYDEGAGLGGKKAFVEPIIRLGYSIPLGPEPQVSTPNTGEVTVIAPLGSDSDNDGVSDNADLCPGTPLGTIVDASGCSVGEKKPVNLSSSPCRAPKLAEAVDGDGCAVERTVILNGVNFEFDSDMLTEAAQAILGDVAQVLNETAGADVEIAGHTSDEGDAFYNIDLSQRRSNTVRRYLIDAGVEASRLRPKGYGDNAPLGANDTASGRRKNRRVEVRIAR